MTSRDFPKDLSRGAFAGTEHYRERAAFLRKHEPIVYHRPYRIDLEALCDHIEDLEKQNKQAWERAALEARRVLKNGSKALRLEKKVEEQDKEIERLREALGFYADESNHGAHSPRLGTIAIERGDKARKALGEVSTHTESSEE